MTTIAVGIDPGRHGAWAMVDGTDGVVMEYDELPYVGKDVNVLKILTDCLNIAATLDPKAVVQFAVEEQMGLQKDGVTNVAMIARNYGRLTGGIETLKLPLFVVKPKQWKDLVLAGTARDKEAACLHVSRRYPTVNLTPGRKRIPHDGIADAVCIAEWLVRSQWREGRT